MYSPQLGLLDEIRTLRKIALEGPSTETIAGQTSETNYSLGVYQAIGKKERLSLDQTNIHSFQAIKNFITIFLIVKVPNRSCLRL
jgi:hypothetical protein